MCQKDCACFPNTKIVRVFLIQKAPFTDFSNHCICFKHLKTIIATVQNVPTVFDKLKLKNCRPVARCLTVSHTTTFSGFKLVVISSISVRILILN